MKTSKFTLLLTFLLVAFSYFSSIPAHAETPQPLATTGAQFSVRLTESVTSSSVRPGAVLDAIVTNTVYGHGSIVVPAGTVAKVRVVNVVPGSHTSNPARLEFEVVALELPCAETPIISTRLSFVGPVKTDVNRLMAVNDTGSAFNHLVNGRAGRFVTAISAGAQSSNPIVAPDVAVSETLLLYFQLRADLVVPVQQ
jgi:hypothetical protein